MRLHGIPVHTVCGFHDGVRRVRLLKQGTVVPHGAGAVRGNRLDLALTDGAEHGAFGGIGEEGGNLCGLVRAAAEMRRVIKRSGIGAARDLVPLASVRSCNKRMRACGPIKLGGAVHLDRGLFAVGTNRLCADTSAADLRIIELTSGELRHVVLKASISDVPADAAGDGGGAGGDGGYGLARERSAVSGGNPAKGPSDKADRAARAHTGPAVHDGVPDIAVALETIGKARRKARGGTRGMRSSRRRAAKDAAGRFAAAEAAECSGGHQQLHTHTGAGLRDAEPHGGQIAVKPLGAFEKGERAEQPEENAALTVCQCAAVSEKLPDRRVESPQKPDIHNEKNQLRADHTAPGAEDGVCFFRAAHGKGKRRGIAEDTDDHISFHSLQKELEIIPAEGDLQNDQKQHPHDRGRGDDRYKSVFQCLLDSGEGEILRGHGHIHQGEVGSSGNVQRHLENGSRVSDHDGEEHTSRQKRQRVLRF